MGPITRSASQDNKLKQTKLTASPNGSIVITDSSPSMSVVDSVSTPIAITLPGTPGRAHRCNSQKTLFPPNSKSIVESLVSEMIDSVVRMESKNDNENAPTTEVNAAPKMDSAPDTPEEEERDLHQILHDAMDLTQTQDQSPESQVPTPPSENGGSLLDFYKKRTIDLQQQVLDIGAQSEKVLAHSKALESSVKLLSKEVEVKMKEIKRLQTDLDKSRLELSKANGLRHHMNSKDCGTSAKKSTDPPPNANILRTIEAELAANRAEMAALKEQLTSVFCENSTEDNGQFQTVRNRRRNRRNRQPPQPAQPSQSTSYAPPPTHSFQPPSYADVTAERIPKPTVLSVGSSLAGGTQNALRNHNIDALEYSFSGADLPRLRREIIPILQENPQVDTVIITGGGNDCEKEGVTLPQIKAEYDALVDTIKLQQGWDCKVVINSVPQRRKITTETRHKIAGLNLEHYYHSDPDNFVYFCDSAPRTGAFFHDRVHLNHHGLDHWARKVAGVVSNFQPVIQQTRM